MKLTLFFLASLPATLAANLAYTPPPALAAQAGDPKNNCDLPEDYHVRDFAAATNNSGNSLTSYKFKFLNTITNSTTNCQYGPESKPQVSSNGGGLPRYSCESQDVSFIWEHQAKKLSMIQKVCPGANGQADYEASGSVIIPLSCSLNSTCQTNGTDYRGIFTSINPIKHARAIRHKRGVAWYFDLTN